MTTDMKEFPSGAQRSTDADQERYDLIDPVMMRRLARVMATGAEKYGDYNWQKGIPISECMNHCIRHLELYLEGDMSEDHLAHAGCNLMFMMHYEEKVPQMQDIPARWKDGEPKHA